MKFQRGGASSLEQHSRIDIVTIVGKQERQGEAGHKEERSQRSSFRLLFLLFRSDETLFLQEEDLTDAAN